MGCSLFGLHEMCWCAIDPRFRVFIRGQNYSQKTRTFTFSLWSCVSTSMVKSFN